MDMPVEGVPERCSVVAQALEHEGNRDATGTGDLEGA